MDKKMKECMKPHGLMHLLTGAGIGLLIAGLVPGIAAQATVLGIIAVVVGIAGDLAVNKG